MKRKKNINFDYNAMAQPTKHVLKTLKKLYREGFHNPSASYLDGRLSWQMMEMARLTIADYLGCDEDEIFFTSGASESNSLVAKNFNLIIDDKSHHSLMAYKEDNQETKMKIRYTTPTSTGYEPKESLIAFPMIVSETGENLLPQYNLDDGNHYFIDLTQAVGKMEINLHNYPGIIAASLSGQKIGGILGAGVLYIKRSWQYKFKPLIYGTQEMGLRGGTENIPAIVCLSVAIEDAVKNMNKNNKKIRKMIDYIVHKIIDDVNYEDIMIDDLSWFHQKKKEIIRVNQGYSNTINIMFNHLSAAAAVQIFDRYGFNISAGSACTSGEEKPSEAYIASGISEDDAMKIIRISLGHNNTMREAKKFIKTLKKVINEYDNEDK